MAIADYFCLTVFFLLFLFFIYVHVFAFLTESLRLVVIDRLVGLIYARPPATIYVPWGADKQRVCVCSEFSIEIWIWTSFFLRSKIYFYKSLGGFVGSAIDCLKGFMLGAGAVMNENTFLIKSQS